MNVGGTVNINFFVIWIILSMELQECQLLKLQ